MGWMYLITAGILEIGWPVGLKMAQNEQYRWQGILLAVVLMFASGVFLFMAQKTVPMGTAYAVWTGIGAVGAFVVGAFGSVGVPVPSGAGVAGTG